MNTFHRILPGPIWQPRCVVATLFGVTLIATALSGVQAVGLPATELPVLNLPYGRDISEDEGVVCLPLTLGEPSAVPVNVHVATAVPTDPVPAVPHEDYVPISGRLAFAPGVTEQEICIRILDDEIDEFAGYFLLVLSDPVNATLNATAVEYFIRDNDGPADLKISQWPTEVVIDPGDVLTSTFTVWNAPLYADVGRTARLDIAVDPASAVPSVAVIDPPFDPGPLAEVSCGELDAGTISCTIRFLTTESVHIALRLTTADDFSGVFSVQAGVTGIRGTINTNPDNTAGPLPVLVASEVWAAEVPIVYGMYDYRLTGVRVQNVGPGDVRLTLPAGPSRNFTPGTDEWWFPVGGGRYVVNATSSSGPCEALTSLGGNSYNIEIDFRPDELRSLSFMCLDASRPPDGTGWTLYYYLEPLDEP